MLLDNDAYVHDAYICDNQSLTMLHVWCGWNFVTNQRTNFVTNRQGDSRSRIIICSGIVVDIFWHKTNWITHQPEPIVCFTFNVPTHHTAPGPKYRAKFMPTPRTDFIIWWKKSSFHGLAIPAQPYVCQPRGITNDQIPNDSRREAQMMRNYLRILTAADSRSHCQWWSDNDIS